MHVAARGGDRDVFEERDALARIAGRYELVIDRLTAEGWPVVVLDGGEALDAVTAAVQAAVEALW